MACPRALPTCWPSWMRCVVVTRNTNLRDRSPLFCTAGMFLECERPRGIQSRDTALLFLSSVPELDGLALSLWFTPPSGNSVQQDIFVRMMCVSCVLGCVRVRVRVCPYRLSSTWSPQLSLTLCTCRFSGVIPFSVNICRLVRTLRQRRRLMVQKKVSQM